MKLAASNIAWSNEHDNEMYHFLSDNGFSGLEIAPTRIFPEAPYDKLEEINAFSKQLKANYNLTLCSMQSIWYGMTGNLFASPEQRHELIQYTKKAILFARAAGIGNLVFGCPKGRNIPDGCTNAHETALAFFDEIGHFAAHNKTVVALEANPPCYHTNFLNRTTEAINFAKELRNPGIKINIDLGTCMYYEEPIALIRDNLDLVNHIHISEIMLVPIEKRDLHRKIALLDYDGYCSIEMGSQGDTKAIQSAISYIREVFH